MTIDAARLQHHSARHYLDDRAGRSSLARTVELVAAVFGFPTVLVNILDGDEQHTIAAHGGTLRSLPRSVTLCDRVVGSGEPLVLPDITEPPALRPDLRSYVGVPLLGREGVAVGSLCLMDTRPRRFPPEQLQQLRAVAVIVQDQLEVLRRLRAGDDGSPAEAHELGSALSAGQVTAHYQPVVDLHTGRLTGWEALARWEHPRRGLLAPAEFLPLAEDSEIVVDLDLTVLRQACTTLADALAADPALRLAVNLSPRHFDHPACVDRLHATVTETGVDPRSIVLEVTETTVIVARPGDRDVVAELRARGFAVFLDDFGTGFSAVEHLLHLPVDGFKVDRAVTAELHTHRGEVVARALLAMADGLGLDTVIEGVETESQAAAARRLGFTRAQGYLWSAPVPVPVPDVAGGPGAGA